MDTTTLQTVIKIINNQLANYKKKMSAKGFDMDKIETPVQRELTKLQEHLQSYIEAQLNSAELQTKK